ncbi:MAG: RNA polymerase sporulation-specific sigma factor [Clostridium sp.]|jgi:RNA polymerase sporulation-specific sigma factor
MISEAELCRLDSSSLTELKQEEMNELLLKLQHGDYECKEIFIKANTKLILSVIKRFNNRGKTVDDLFKVGCIGVMKATQKFNLSLSDKFSTYALPIIIEEIRRYLVVNNQTRASKALRDIAYKALKVRDNLVSSGKKEPTISQIAKELELSKEDIVFALDMLPEIKM